MRILMLPRFGLRGANSRYRLWQYIPLFQGAGCTVDVKPMLDDGYLDSLYRNGTRPLRSLVKGYARQVSRMLVVSRYETVLLDQELVPYLPAAFEQLLCRLNRCVIVDYDDAAYVKYQRSRPLRRKIEKIMQAAHTVVVGNRHLETYARQFTNRVRLIPTVVDLCKYTPKSDYTARDGIRICWIGTPVTAKRFLIPMLPVLSKLQSEIPELRFRFIGAGNFNANGLRLESLSWSEEGEAKLLGESDIGIMPLQDEEFERGKCGLKLIQYMAAGLPVVASPVGENRQIVDHGHNGFLVNSPEDWIRAIRILADRPDLRQQMGTAGRLRAERDYSLAKGFSEWQQVIGSLRNQTKTPESSGTSSGERF